MAAMASRNDKVGRETNNLAPDKFVGLQRGMSVKQDGIEPHLSVGHCSTLTRLTNRAEEELKRPFDPAAWLADWSDHGGIVAVIGDRLWIGRAPCLDRNAAHRLNSIRGHVMRPDAATALRGVLRGNFVEAEA